MVTNLYYGPGFYYCIICTDVGTNCIHLFWKISQLKTNVKREMQIDIYHHCCRGGAANVIQILIDFAHPRSMSIWNC